MSETFKNSLKLTKIALLLSGINIYPSNNAYFISLLNYVFIINLLWLHTDVLAEFFWLVEGIHEGKSFTELSLIAPCTTLCIMASAKNVPMFVYRKNIVNVIGQLKKIHEDCDENSEHYDEDHGNVNEIFRQGLRVQYSKQTEMVERKIVRNGLKLLNIVVRLLSHSLIAVALTFVTIPLIYMSYQYHKSGKLILQLPFLTKYFFDPFTKVTWPIIYLHQVWSTFIVVFNIFGADTFVYAFCTYAHIQFRILCNRFEHVVSNSTQETRQRLMVLIKRHQELIGLVDQIELIFSKANLINIVTSSVVICLSAFNMTTVSDDNAVVFAYTTFLIMSLSQIFLLCLFGDLLMSSSMDVAKGIYNCRWYNTDPSNKRIIFLILIRTQKPCRLTAAKFANLNLGAFTTILSRSWSYFALLRTVYK